MRKLLASCATAGSLLLGAAGVAASQGPADAATTDQMVCDYTLVNGICNMGQAQAGQPYEGFLDTSAMDSGYFTVTGTVPPGLLVRGPRVWLVPGRSSAGHRPRPAPTRSPSPAPTTAASRSHR